MTLAEFLLARIAEDKTAATVDGGWARMYGRAFTRRVLAESEAKRRIVDDFQHYDADVRAGFPEFTQGTRQGCLLALARLAEVYADHPDYQPEWRP